MKPLPLRQRIRKALVILAFLSFPITMNYLSPYVIVESAAHGVVNGSLVMFALMFLSSFFLGRLWCGWLCPGGGMQEIVEPLNNRPVKPSAIGWIKWLIWVPWVSIIIVLAVRAGGYHSIDLLQSTQGGISLAGAADRPIIVAYVIYYLVIALFTGLAVVIGRRAGCHTVCWMAPFMILGRWTRNRFAWPSLRLVADASACSNCELCTKNCPMSLDVDGMVQVENMESPACILCGTCVDNCPQKVIHFSFSPGR